MKDYTFKSEDKDKFILNYEIRDGNIIIRYANGKEYVTPYTKEIEKDILNKMKLQVFNISTFIEKKNDLDEDDFIGKQKEIRIINTTIIIILGILAGLIPYVYVSIPLITILISSLIFELNKRNKIIEDYKKNKCFIDNIELFQKFIDRDMGTYKKMNCKSKKFIKETISKREENSDIVEPNINSIDKLSSNDFYQVYELVKKNEEFSKYYEGGKPKKKILSKSQDNYCRNFPEPDH